MTPPQLPVQHCQMFRDHKATLFFDGWWQVVLWRTFPRCVGPDDTSTAEHLSDSLSNHAEEKAGRQEKPANALMRANYVKWSKLRGTWLPPQEFLTLLFYERTLHLHLPSHWHPWRCRSWRQSSGNAKGQEKYKPLSQASFRILANFVLGMLFKLTTIILIIVLFLIVNSLSLSISSSTIFPQCSTDTSSNKPFPTHCQNVV